MQNVSHSNKKYNFYYTLLLCSLLLFFFHVYSIPGSTGGLRPLEKVVSSLKLAGFISISEVSLTYIVLLSIVIIKLIINSTCMWFQNTSFCFFRWFSSFNQPTSSCYESKMRIEVIIIIIIIYNNNNENNNKNNDNNNNDNNDNNNMEHLTSLERQVEPPCVTTSRKWPPPISDGLSKTPKLPQSNPSNWNLS